MLVALFVFLLGVCIGSFTNVLIFRLPESKSIVTPGSSCRSCGRPLAWFENVPLLSYLVLRGRCRTCGARISPQYPLVELTVGLLFLGNFLLFAQPAGDLARQMQALAEPRWIVGAVFTTLLLAIALTDLRTYLIPDELSLGGLVVGLLLSFLPGKPSAADAFLGAALGGFLLLAVAWLGRIVFGKDAMGGGDVKMLAMIGAFVGWGGVFMTLFLGALLGSLIYGPIVLLQRLRGGGAPRDEVAAESDVADEVDRSLVPFGFFLAPAAALTFYLSEEIVRAYLRLVGFDS